MKDYPLAIQWFENSLEAGKKINDLEIIKASYQGLRDCYEKTKNFDKAFEYQNLFHQTRDSLINEKNSKEIAELMGKYNTEKKDREIAILNSENEKNRYIKYGTFAFLAIILLFGIVGYNNIRVKSQATQLAKANEIRQKISRDLHDEIGIGLTSIFMICDKEIRKANDREDHKFKALNEVKSQVMGVSNKLRELVWSTKPENDNLRALSAYLREYIYNLFEHSDIKLNLEIPDEVEPVILAADVGRNLMLAIKETLNNCLKHSNADELNVSMEFIDNRQYKIKISDNGKGFDLEPIMEKPGGIHNVRKRIENIKGNFSIVSEIGKGTSIEIEGAFV
jgi:signal transduction histidine kinase